MSLLKYIIMPLLYQQKTIVLLFIGICIFACAKKQHIDFSEIRKAADHATEQMERQSDYSLKEKNSQKKPQNIWKDGEWIISIAECPAVNISRKEAMRRALEEARNNAIEYAVGIKISSSKLLYQSTNRLTSLTSFINVSSYGKIIEEQEPKWEEFDTGKNQQGLTLWNYRVTVKCKVQKEEGNTDPGFVLKLQANKMKYKVGDEIKFIATSSRECYLTIFNFYESDDKVFIIYPNAFDNNNKLIANEPRIIPASSSGVSFEALLPEGHDESQELILVVATKKPVDFAMGLKNISAFSFISTPVAAITEINRRLVGIPLNERAQTSDIILIER